MAVITISRQYGSRGAAIGAQVAERLGWRYVDDDPIFLVAHRAGIGDQHVRAYLRPRQGGEGPVTHEALW